MRFLIAPDKFKGSLEAAAVAENIARGVRDVLAAAVVEIAPIADGGEGTAEIIQRGRGGEWVNCPAHDPLGREIMAHYVWIAEAQLAVLEMSEPAGMRRLRPEERDPLRATTFGVGELLLDAARRGAREIIIGLGGSATNDGGFGMARALGYRFFADDEELTGGPAELVRLTGIAVPSPGASRPLLRRAPDRGEGGNMSNSGRSIAVTAAVDVSNPLLGPQGATRVFGPQKGVAPEQLDLLERGLANLADVAARDLGSDFRDRPGAGAAGGLGFGLLAFCGAEIRSGFDVVAEAVDLESKVAAADVVITGEGRLDSQTLSGKGPARLAQMARSLNTRVCAVVGELGDESAAAMFDCVRSLVRPPVTRTIAQERTSELLRERAREIVHFYLQTNKAE